MNRVFATVRGYVNKPCILEIDLASGRVCNLIEIAGLDSTRVPDSKRGFAGLQLHDGHLFAAAWDRICVIDPANGRLVDTITDPRFSDLHGLHVDEMGCLWVASTNLDGIYRISGDRVDSMWHVWESPELGRTLSWQDRDYRQITKQESPYHAYHVNSVYLTDRWILVSYLGDRCPMSRVLNPGLARLGIQERRHRDGGIFVLDRGSMELQKNVKCEGLHDPCLGSDGSLYYTEYFGNALARFDPESGDMERIALDVPCRRTWGYLTRGVVQEGDFFWIGHTQRRGWHASNPLARLRQYDAEGHWTEKELCLPGYVGIYEMIQSRRSATQAASHAALHGELQASA
jgi:hypothetical protein